MRQVLLAAVVLGLACVTPAFSQNRVQPLVTRAINENDLVTLTGNTRPEALVAANDQGVVAGDTPLPHMLLQLRRPAAQQQALATAVEQLYDRTSPNYQHWLTGAEIASQFAPVESDIQAVTDWLSQHGFAVNIIYRKTLAIDFSGTADQVSSAFHTEIHHLLVEGVAHISNISDPQIPAALAPVVVGIVSLHDFRPSPMVAHTTDPKAQAPLPDLTSGSYHYMTPGDLATIYNFKPLFNAGLTGKGGRIDLVEDSNLYASSDWSTFRSAFGLATNYPNGTLTTQNPVPGYGPNNCTDPGINGDDGEATLDAEYASAAAPDAAIVLNVCANTTSTSGIVIALQNMVDVNGVNPISIISVSYGQCEVLAGAATNATFENVYLAATGEGISVYVSAGDQAAAGCNRTDFNSKDSINVPHTGIGVNGWASTPYNVAVGGTDFEDTVLGENSNYWNSSNATDNSSAKSYIPEMPWNSTCGSVVFAQYEGYDYTYGAAGFCNSDYIINGSRIWLQNWAGSGGPSECATGAPLLIGVVSGSCQGYAKPSWQNLVGVPNNGVRNLPDVSLFSSSAPWYHSYIICYSDPTTGRSGVSPCTTSPSGWSYGWGGTSFASPIWAGIQALINQAQGSRQGFPNPRLYQIAAAEYGALGNSKCFSNNGPPSFQAACIFYDVTYGDNDVPCVGDSWACYSPSGTYGVLSTDENSYQPAYRATTGWDFTTGIGTVNVANLVAIWNPKLTQTHDFGNDGRSDIAWRDGSGNVAVWLMSGASVQQSRVLGTVPANWSLVGQRDFNSDGNSDLLWRDTAGDVVIWFMNGALVSSAASVGNVPPAWLIAGTGDFNGDGRGDIVWRDGAGNTSIWLMNGSQVAQAVSLGAIPTTWSIVGVGDFDGDGRRDILWRDTSGNTSIWFMSGTTVTSSAAVGNIPTTWSVVGTGDFNADGKTDVVWRDTAGNTAIWLMNGGSVLSSAAIGSVPLTWSIAETGDFNGDAKSDLLWRDTSGNTAIWFMNGATIASTGSVGNISTNWAVQSVNAE